MFDFFGDYKWLWDHKAEIFGALAMIVGALEILVRLTPTTADDGAVERIGKTLKRIMDFLRIPNNLKPGDQPE